MTPWNRRRFLLTAAPLLLAGCAGFQPAPPDPRREAVDRLVQRLERELRVDCRDALDWAFSPDFRDLSLVRNRWQDRWTQRQTTSLQLQTGRILENGGLLNVQVRWNRLERGTTGQLLRSAGTAELILEPFRNQYRIRQILGDSFF